jgi:hypothetical protein
VSLLLPVSVFSILSHYLVMSVMLVILVCVVAEHMSPWTRSATPQKQGMKGRRARSVNRSIRMCPGSILKTWRNPLLSWWVWISIRQKSTTMSRFARLNNVRVILVFCLD